MEINRNIISSKGSYVKFSLIIVAGNSIITPSSESLMYVTR